MRKWEQMEIDEIQSIWTAYLVSEHKSDFLNNRSQKHELRLTHSEICHLIINLLDRITNKG